MIPFSSKYKKRSFDALTYVKPSRRDVQQGSWQPETWEVPERQRFERDTVWVPETNASFVNAGRRETQRVLFSTKPEATRDAHWPGYRQNFADTVCLNRPVSPMRRPFRPLESSSDDFYGTTENSSSYCDSRFSSECATVVRATGQQTFKNEDSSSVATAHATWTASLSSNLEESSSARNEAFTSGDFSGSSSQDEGTRPRLSNQLCLPIIGLAMLTSLLLLSAVTTVLKMNGVAGPAAAASQPLQSTSRDLAVHEIVALMTPRELFPQQTAAAVLPKSQPPLRRRDRPVSRSAGNQASSTTGEDEFPTGGATTDFFDASAVALVGNLQREAHRANKRITDGFETSSASSAALTKPRCEEPSYTYCSESSPAFVYSRSRDACLRASQDTAELCSRGRNRFSSMHRCEMRCILSGSPSPSCLEKPHFVPCGRNDVKSDLWFFDGNGCVPWNFPSGHCTSNGSDVFATASECASRCTKPQSAPCSIPQPAACRRRMLRFPFFAHLSSQDGRVLCLRASASALRGRRCLVGDNLFNSTQACEHACRKPSS